MGSWESFYYARELFYHGRYKEAIDELTHYLTLPDSWMENCLDACRTIAACYDMTDRPDAAVKYIETVTVSLCEGIFADMFQFLFDIHRYTCVLH